MKSALSIKGFRRIWIGQIVSQIGDKFYAIALAVWIADGRGTPLAMAVFLVATILPGLLIGPLAGAIADRRDRKSLLIASDVLRAAIVAGVAALYALGSLQVWEIVVAAAAISATSAFFAPSLSASIPAVVGEGKLGEANSLSQFGGGVTSVLGPALGAFALGFMGYTAVFAFNAASFLASAALIAATSIPRRECGPGEGNLAGSIREGLRFVLGSRLILAMLTVVALVHFAMGTVSVAFPFLAKAAGGQTARNLGFLEACLGAGLIIGSLASARLAAKRGIGTPFALLAFIGAVIGAMGAAELVRPEGIAPFLALSACLGLGIAVAAAAWTTGLQKEAPDSLRGRVFGLSSTLSNASLPLGMTLAGTVLVGARLGALFLPLGAVLAMAGLILATRGRRAKGSAMPGGGKDD